MTDKDQLTDRGYWDSTYRHKDGIRPMPVAGYKNRCQRKLYEIKKRIGITDKRIIEIGGGGSRWLACLAQEAPSSDFWALDYSTPGCDLITAFARDNQLANLHVLQDDFMEPARNHETYDFVYSHGVVEHYPDLSSALSAKARFLKDQGRMLTVIPNMAGILGTLTRWLDREVYDIHVPHDLGSFERGHTEAGLTVVESGYVCSSNFSVLSSCLSGKGGGSEALYTFATRMNKLVWLFEDNVVSFPETRLFSPYIYVVSRKPEDLAP